VAEPIRQVARTDGAGWKAVWHFSIVVAVRCEVQAIDQHWSCHRLALAVADGERDAALEAELDLLAGRAAPDRLVWPTTWPADWPHWLERALREDVAEELGEIQRRQERFLGRELARVDEYFTNYAGELTARIGRAQEGRVAPAVCRPAARGHARARTPASRPDSASRDSDDFAYRRAVVGGGAGLADGSGGTTRRTAGATGIGAAHPAVESAGTVPLIQTS